ncbi:MAG: glycine--tRNA ligase subunit beta [Gammaproteobacteria bacterium]|nr:glycine--tRNA ligase subunit beta [Gammaproteobacteria bacterium]
MTINTQHFLFELGVEELPTKAVKNLSSAFGELLTKELENFNLSFKNLKIFATPRRLGCLITDLQTKQADYTEEKRGPALKAAYDQNNNFTKAALGFASSFNVKPEQLEKLETDKGSWLIYKSKVTGKKTENLLQEIISNAIHKLPIPKPMRWSNKDYSFIRPVHWVLGLFGDKKCKFEFFGFKADNKTYGHRFLAAKSIVIKSPLEYEKKLKKAFVIADFNARLNTIQDQITAITKKTNYLSLNTPELLEEVTSLVEWPVALLGKFDENFLKVPQECLITSMVTNQKYFPVVDKKNKLQPYFVFISNITSKNPKQVIQGNQRVLSARLKDAEFFYHTDKKQTLESRVALLNNITYQQKLGSLADKTSRVSKISVYLAENLKNFSINMNNLTRAAQLARADLCTEMVYEFPELQGIMGKYYALSDGEDTLTTNIIEQQYLPKFSGDNLPESTEACCLAIAEKLDTIISIFAIDQKPTGDKDPFGLRRAALGLLRILIEKRLPVDLKTLITQSVEILTHNLSELLKLNPEKQKQITQDCLEFCFERLKKYYSDQNISLNLFYSVNNTKTYSPFDFDQRIKAVSHFINLPESSHLIAANKRVKNILSKQNSNNLPKKINLQLLSESEEINLNEVLLDKNSELSPLFAQQDYKNILTSLSKLQNPIDNFFDKVMVNAADQELKNNRLLLLLNIQTLFNQVADISELQ